ncbi:MAG: diacylglycerol kinase family lipid kinase [Dehalococcoidales bacterium]|nr:diacylglycerol kinase family lipid kinase [Dehalococcoidales bacterium]
MLGKSAIAIVNPAAGGYSTGREWPSIGAYLKDKGHLFDQVFTEGRDHATQLALQASREGYETLIAVGGDGTINEVVNGILNADAAESVSLGIISAGTTCSFARSLGISSNHIRSCESILNGEKTPVDIGTVEYSVENRRLHRYFVNEADIGFGATVVEASRRISNYFGRKINYLPHVIGGLTSLLSFQNKCINIRTEDGSEDIYDCAMVVIANGDHFGGGMRMAPDACPDDGFLDMVIFGDMEKSELLKVWPMTYRGRHVSHHKVKLLKIKNVTIQCEEKILVETDGELIGEGPVHFSVLPSALKVYL